MKKRIFSISLWTDVRKKPFELEITVEGEAIDTLVEELANVEEALASIRVPSGALALSDDTHGRFVIPLDRIKVILWDDKEAYD